MKRRISEVIAEAIALLVIAGIVIFTAVCVWMYTK